MENMSDDEIGLILRKLSCNYDRKSCSRVCSQWRRVEGSSRDFLRILDPQDLSSFLPRYRNLRVLEAGKGLCDYDLEVIADTCPLLEVLNLNVPTTVSFVDLVNNSQVDTVTDHGISAMAAKCKALKEIHLKRRKGFGDLGLTALLKSCHNIVHLDLAFCNRLTDQALEAIAASGTLQVLIMQGCTLVTDKGLISLVAGRVARGLKTLDLSECDKITDSGVSLLQQLSCLQVLNLASCGSRITDSGGIVLGKISTLEILNISWLVSISDVSLIAVAKHCPHLKEINISGCESVTGDGICAFARHSSLQVLILDACYNVVAEDIEHTVLGCSTLEFLGLDRAFRYWISSETLHRIEDRCQVEWL